MCSKADNLLLLGDVDASFAAHRAAMELALDALPPASVPRVTIALGFADFCASTLRNVHMAYESALPVYEAALGGLSDERAAAHVEAPLQTLRDRLARWGATVTGGEGHAGACLWAAGWCGVVMKEATLLCGAVVSFQHCGSALGDPPGRLNISNCCAVLLRRAVCCVQTTTTTTRAMMRRWAAASMSA